MVNTASYWGAVVALALSVWALPAVFDPCKEWSSAGPYGMDRRSEM